MSLQALCTVAISSTLDSRAYQCRTHSEAHKVLLRQYRRWCATCFGRRTWWQRYGSVSPHLDLNILFVETYQITLIWYFQTRPLQSLNSEPVNISGRSQASLVFSDLHLFSFWGSFPFQRSRVPIVLSYYCCCGSPSSWWHPSLLIGYAVLSYLVLFILWALDVSRLSLPPGGAYLSCSMPMGCLVFDLFYAPTGTYLVTYCRYCCLSFS